MIAIIPARSGSRRIPDKNIKEFRGKPIIQYSIEVAERSGLFQKVIVSTDILELWDFFHKRHPLDPNSNDFIDLYKRPAELSGDKTGTQAVVKDVLEKKGFEYVYEADIVCCIYATSPLLATEDLARGLALLKSNRSMQYAFSVGTSPLSDAGNFYWGYREAFLADIPVHGERSIMVPISEDRVCDINTPEDWSRAEEMYDKLHGGRS